MHQTETVGAVPPRVLMIDDEVANLQIVKIILTREQLTSELLLYSDGREALEYLREHAVDVILLDLDMPGMDGFEVLARLKESPATAGIPVIVLTASPGPEDVVRAFELGALDVIDKPFVSAIFTARIRKACERAKVPGR